MKDKKTEGEQEQPKEKAGNAVAEAKISSTDTGDGQKLPSATSPTQQQAKKEAKNDVAQAAKAEVKKQAKKESKAAKLPASKKKGNGKETTETENIVAAISKDESNL